MHSKQKGNIAFSSVVLDLQKHGFNVFTEVGDYSRVDIIAEKNSKLIKIQVKYAHDEKGYVTLSLVKSGPNGYRYTYTEDDVDWFAIYSPSTEKIAWVSAKEACKQERTFAIRITPSKNNQYKGIHLIEDYGIDGLLRDFTQDIVTSYDEDKVQTTTKKAMET